MINLQTPGTFIIGVFEDREMVDLLSVKMICSLYFCAICVKISENVSIKSNGESYYIWQCHAILFSNSLHENDVDTSKDIILLLNSFT